MEEDKLTIKISKKKEETNKPPKRVKIVLSKEEGNKDATTKDATTKEVNTKDARTKEKGNKEAKTKEGTKEAITKEVETKLKGDNDISKLSTLLSLKEHCKQLGIKGISKKNKTELLEIIKNHN